MADEGMSTYCLHLLDVLTSILKFMGFASFSVLLWDHLITFSDEVSAILLDLLPI